VCERERERERERKRERERERDPERLRMRRPGPGLGFCSTEKLCKLLYLSADSAALLIHIIFVQSEP